MDSLLLRVHPSLQENHIFNEKAEADVVEALLGKEQRITTIFSSSRNSSLKSSPPSLSTIRCYQH
jgi:hypothetical protein